MSSHASLPDLLDRWRVGDQQAADEIYRLYEDRLVQLAEQRIGPMLRPHVQPESVMLLVLKSALGGVAKGKYSADPSGSLWGLLRTLTENKIRKRWEYLTAKKRDVRREVRPEDQHCLSEPTHPDPTPEEVAALAEELQKVRSRLKPAHFEVFQLVLQGHTLNEIAKQQGCAYHAVRSKVDRVRERLRRLTGEDSGD